MVKLKYIRGLCVAGSALLCGIALSTAANAGAFGVREQSAYFQGMSFAGDAAGGDISSMYWNSAATATLPGFNTSSNITAVFGHADETAAGGAFFVPGLTPASADVGTNGIVPSSYATYQLSERLYAGLGMNAPFGFITKPDHAWAGSSLGVTSKVFSIDINPTLAYKLTPEISVGVGAQIEYFKTRLTHDNFDGLSGKRSFDANDWGVGATAGIMWQPRQSTSIGLGYRSAVGVEPEGNFNRTAGLLSGPALNGHATSSITLPDEVTLSARQNVTSRLAILGTVEWQNWSRVKTVSAVGPGCAAAGGTCEVLNFNYRDGWLFSGGLEYAYSPSLTLRTGVAYETSPVQDSTRDLLLPDANRVHLSFGATYKYSDKIGVNLGYSHLFMEDAPFCMAQALNGTGATHCGTANSGPTLLKGSSDNSIDIVSLGINYHVGGPRAALEPYK